MNRATLLESLSRHESTYPEEMTFKSVFTEFIRSVPDCFSRDFPARHITGSAWILDASRTACLLTHHAKLDRWLQLGGHADGEEDVAAVALREAREESGLSSIRLLTPHIFDIDIHLIPANSKQQAHDHYDIRFLFEADSGEPLSVSSESKDLVWVSLADAPALVHHERSVMRMIEKTYNCPNGRLAL